MRRRGLSLTGFSVVLALLACKGQEVTVFDMPTPGGSAGVSGAGDAGAGTAGSLAAAGDMNGGGLAGGGAGLATGGNGGALGGGGAAGAAGVAGMPAGSRCAQDTECPPGWLCEKSGCDAPSGVCEPGPVFLPPEPAPVCGCDGITYWNDQIRRQHGATLASPGECRGSACSCEIGADCKVQDASCSHLVSPGDMCGHGTGACWMLPPQCVPIGDPMVWRECRPPDSPDPPPPCVDTCMAIRSERPHAPPHHDECH